MASRSDPMGTAKNRNAPRVLLYRHGSSTARRVPVTSNTALPSIPAHRYDGIVSVRGHCNGTHRMHTEACIVLQESKAIESAVMQSITANERARFMACAHVQGKAGTWQALEVK